MTDCVEKHFFLHDPTYLNARYGHSIKTWMAVFPRQHFLLMTLEHLQAYPSEVYNRTLRFLSLRPFAMASFENENKRSSKPYIIRKRHYQRMVDHVKNDTDLLDEIVQED